ncbi:hypothetical protein M413DRAFT_430427 [Hebeloma cylindrosporum]|uniref:Uncharacterized protein n=1 Tax=Hebeloma cylindrosporum TaxID=76867 RepID=A0A0C3CPH3_HEBCY|nr:hypothetical protein M413DRAFT_430427 [Hebeloma cylindrosporum h7]
MTSYFLINIAEYDVPLIDAVPQASSHQDNDDPQIHEIKIIYHPASKRADEHFRADDNIPNPSPVAEPEQPNAEKPWHPFRSRVDFEIAELALNAHLSKADTEHLLSIIQKCIQEPEQFTLRGHKDISDYWDLARSTTAGFTKKTMAVPYQETEFEFDTWTRSLEDWCAELLGNPQIFPYIQWDAQKKFQHNGVAFERVIDEPWTADALWDIQSNIPEGGKPLCILLYADKTRLSSFGTAKAHPVLARLAQLPVEMRNGEDIGGGRLVGWLPIIKEDAAESGKKDYVNLKRVVWHESFAELLKTLAQYSKTGWFFTGCADGIPRWLFPVILLLSADYEEQCIMALIRGLNSHFPCPVCLVPDKELSDLSKTFKLRTTQDMKAVYEKANEAVTAGDKEVILKEYGLRDVKNAFWALQNTDVYAALSWDRLHAYHGGLFSDHLWVLFKSLLGDLGRNSEALFDRQIDAIPRWRGLNHFSALLKNSEFSDSSKYEDMGKIVIYGAQNILTEEASSEGFLVLKITRSYLELDMYASLTFHTETTLAAGREELQRYGALIKEHQRRFPGSKSWNFPKAHTHKHLFDDIERKGVTRNYNSKPNEKAHRPSLKGFYLLDTNFKDTDPQILKLSEKALIALMIRRKIEVFDEKAMEKADPSVIGSDHVLLGAQSPSVSIAEVELRRMDDVVFTDFRKKIGKAFSNYFNENIRFSADEEITPYKMLKVNYYGVLNSREMRTDILRVNPHFHGQTRYDYALIKVDKDRCMFAQLVEVFGITFRGRNHYMALIIPFDRTVPLLNRKQDKALRLTRVRSRRRSESVVVDTEAIIRGALLIKDDDSVDESLVLEAIDDDFWWRMKSVKLAQNVNM